LLEYLAGELVRNGWSAKAVHRVILHSATYRQVSHPAEEERGATAPSRASALGPASAPNLRRLDAEAIRDAMLAVSGELDQRSGGPYVPTSRDDDGDVVVAEDAEGANRRSIYLQQRRTQVPGILETFDAPSIVFNCTFRTSTTVPLQSLKLLNSDFVRSRATALAKRAEREAGTDVSARIRRTFVLTVARDPNTDELAAAEKFIASQPNEYSEQPNADELAWIDFCHMLLASNAFLYVD
jgi:hypothetical protein